MLVIFCVVALSFMPLFAFVCLLLYLGSVGMNGEVLCFCFLLGLSNDVV